MQGGGGGWYRVIMRGITMWPLSEVVSRLQQVVKHLWIIVWILIFALALSTAATELSV